MGDDTPGNRAVEALRHAGAPYFVGHPDDHSELERHAAAGDIAIAIRRNQDYLTLGERMVLAAALLPEFDAPGIDHDVR
jgi:hypothetical protein